MLRKSTHVIPCGKFDYKSAVDHSMTSRTLVPWYVCFFLFYPAFNAKPLPEPMPTSSLLNSLEQHSVKFESKQETCKLLSDQGPVPQTIFQSNLKFDPNLECAGLKCPPPITAKFCTRQDSETRDVCKVSLWSVKYILKPEHCKFWSNFEFDRNIFSGTGARSPSNTCHNSSAMVSS